MNGQNRRAAVRFGSALFALLLVFIVVAFLTGGDDTKSGGASSDSTTTTESSDSRGEETSSSAPAPDNKYDRDELIRLITVDEDTISIHCLDAVRSDQVIEVDGDQVIDYEVGANASVSSGQRIPGGLSTPLEGRTAPRMLRSVYQKVCGDNLYACTVARFFQPMVIDGIRVADMNPWLERMVKSDEDINNCAARLVAVEDADKMSDEDLAKAVVNQNRRSRYYTARVATLVDRFVLLGVRAEKSVRNYHLVGEGVVAGTLPEVELNPKQESLPALQLTLTPKGVCVPLVVIGFNVLDARPEEFAPPTCADTPTTSTTPPSGGCRRDCSTTTSTTRPPTTSTTTPCPSGKCVPPTTTPTSPTPTGPTTPSTRPTPTTTPPTTAMTAHPPPPTTLAPKPLTCEELEAQGLPLPDRCL